MQPRYGHGVDLVTFTVHPELIVSSKVEVWRVVQNPMVGVLVFHPCFPGKNIQPNTTDVRRRTGKVLLYHLVA